ncbi:MAG: TIGR01459 family HAD-type hydrolase [Pseudomonadota bacterium]
MVTCIDKLDQIAEQFDAIVLDQWGVLHDGGSPFPGAIAALEKLSAGGVRLAVLSNSGRRSGPNAKRVAEMGFPASLFECFMTSGEALWRTFAKAGAPPSLHVIGRTPADGAEWAEGLDLSLRDHVSAADAVLLMGLPDDCAPETFAVPLAEARARSLPLYCSNPDLVSPRPGGDLVMSPGALAKRYEESGGTVHYFGKPHRPIFDAVAEALDITSGRLLMVGDSLHHDILGGSGVGWRTLLIRSGIHANALAEGDAGAAVAALARAENVPAPDYSMEALA